MSGDDLAGLESLYRAEYPKSVRLARLLVSDQAVAEELTQEAFIRLMPNAATLDNPAGYLRTVLVNLCRDHHRRQATARRHPVAPSPDVGPPGLPRELDEVWQAVQRLPDRRREALVLRYYADLPTDEIAEILGTRPATVRSLIHRGLNSLKEVLADA